MYETDYAVTLRTPAPVEVVWDELRTLERLLENMPTVSAPELDADGRQATFTGGLARWPVSWRSLHTQARMEASDEPRRLEWTVMVPDVDLHFTGTFELEPVAADETKLTYRGVLRCGDRHAGRLRNSLAEILEGHMDDLATRIASRAARRTAAAQALADA